MGFVDWNRIWNEEMIHTGRIRLNDGRYWNRVAAGDRNDSFTFELTEKQLGLIAPATHKHMIEIGPGLGRLTVPLAKLSSSITAVDPSGDMLERLKLRAAGEEVDNIIYLNMFWQDLKPEMLPERPDIVLASYSLFMPDIALQLKKMNDLAGEKVILFVPGEPRSSSVVKKILYGNITTPGSSDHVILFNLLQDLGFDVNVEMMGFRSRKEYESVDDAVREFVDYHHAPAEKVRDLAGYLSGCLTKENGKFVMEQDKKTAALWWWRS